MEDALREQRYADIAAVAPLAARLSLLLESGGSPEAASGEAISSPSAARHLEPKRFRQREEPKQTAYPRFERDGDKLV